MEVGEHAVAAGPRIIMRGLENQRLNLDDKAGRIT